MKQLIFSFFSLIVFTVNSQSFSSPESVEFDATRSRWMVSQNGSGQIHVYYPSSGNLVSFATGISTGPHGLEILGDTLYACDGGIIHGYDLSTGSEVATYNLGATFLNGLTTDGIRFLFATDFSAKKIYRIDAINGTFNVMTSTTKTPNGIIYDAAGNRLVFVTWGSSAPVQSMNLADSSVSTLLTTSLSNCDGITRDAGGDYYINAWGTNSLYKVKGDFSTAPIQLMSDLSSPADLDISALGDSIAIPNSGTANNVVFYVLPNLLVEDKNTLNVNIFPNPVQSILTLQLEDYSSFKKFILFDQTGKEICNGALSSSQTQIDLQHLPSGQYFLVVKDKSGNEVYNSSIIKE